jgi:L-asparaginase
MLAIATAARDAAREGSVDGVVVTHGTTTLEYTAFLSDLVADGGVPVVFTGAMRRADDPDPDGPGNLRDALRVAASPTARDLGVLVVLAGRVMAGRSVWKARRRDRDAFVDLAGDVGSLEGDRLTITRRPVQRAALSGRLAPNVAFLKAVPGADGTAIERMLQQSVAGMVVEGLPGAGGIPPRMQEAVITAAQEVPVVISSRAPYGRLPAEVTGGTGEPLAGGRLLSAGQLTAEQAWLLLMALLGEHSDPERARSAFVTAATA